MILFWDLGFQLSFLATAGIIFLYPLWKENSFCQQDWFNQKGQIIRETLLSKF
jgi:predicted membrane metal-binding protein